VTILPTEQPPARSELARRLRMSDAQLELIRRMAVHPDAPDDVVELYLAKCRVVGVDPLDRLIYVIPRRANVKDDRTGQWRTEIRWTIQGGIDLFRSIAEQSGDYAGQLGPFWSNDGAKWSDVWLDETPPKVCKVGILRKTFKEPLWTVGTYAYFVPRDSKGEPAPGNFWKGEKGAHQLAKCVEELALRKAFPRKLHGVYGDDEMAQAPRPVTMKQATAALPAREPAPPREAAPEEPAIDAEVIEQPVERVESRSDKPEEYRRKAGIGAVHKLLEKRGIPDQDYREILVDMFGVKRFSICGNCLQPWEADDPKLCANCGSEGALKIRPTSSVLDVGELERLWLRLNERRA
jgi:hypothetical protein